MLTPIANRDSAPSCASYWPRVREFAVPASMIETATARRLAGDWGGACAAAGVDVDFRLRAVARDHGTDVAAALRADLRRLAPELLRWHLPRIAPDGLLRPGLTIALARYGPVRLVARTPPAGAETGQRVSLALWHGEREDRHRSWHPHPRPSPRFRLDLHRHLWDAERAHELRHRSGADRPPAPDPVPAGPYAVDRWAEETAILLRAEGRPSGLAVARLDRRQRLLLELTGTGPDGSPGLRIAPATGSVGRTSAVPLLPDAATWVPPDLALLRAGAIDADRLHPLVAAALAPGRPAAASAPRPSDRPWDPRIVECRGARHRIGLVDGALAPLDHTPEEIRREELLAALSGTPLPCLQAVDRAHRRPDCLPGVRERLDHGDLPGALAMVEDLLGPDAAVRNGDLRDELEDAVRGRIEHGLFRAGLFEPAPAPPPDTARPTGHRPRRRRRHSR
ncbi:serine/threonine-protein kinase [Streptacidiphilus rugosus]|uniref:hypothetical protein n=1 Tax=Streptacidiphilus rugosus TaxID=405783 RepID=UPI000565203D|nr:hypothetical protein [Streptacidiphilus rugosus]